MTVEPAPVVLVIGALAPYTHRLYRRLAHELDRPLHVLACSAREAARQWDLPGADGYRFEVLPGLRWYRSALSNLYINPAVVPRLLALRPAAIVVNDFAPTMLLAARTARLRGIPYGIRTDGVPETDPGRRSAPHRLMRRMIVSGAAFGIGASRGSLTLLEGYGLAPDSGRISPLFPAWEAAPELLPDIDRPFDVLFCGMLNEAVKGARFFTDVVLACQARGRLLRVRVAGDGPLRAEMEARFAGAGIAAQFDGFVQQEGLAAVYASARTFLFPSRGDVWGIVVQEALQSGAAVLASPDSGAARDLVVGWECGLVRPMEVETWASATLQLLDDPSLRRTFRDRAVPALARFSLSAAAEAYHDVLAPHRPATV